MSSSFTNEIITELTTPPKTLLPGIKLSAFIEIALFMTIAIVADHYFFAGDRYWNIYPHPFWLPVILLSVQYGTTPGMMAATVASVILFTGDFPSQDMGQDYFNYLFTLSARPLMWFVSAIILGELTNRHIKNRFELVNTLIAEKQRADDMTEAYQEADATRTRLEEHIASQVKSSVSAFVLAGTMNVRQYDEALKDSIELIKHTTNSEKFAIYFLRDNQLQAGVREGWAESDVFAESIPAGHGLFKATVGERRLVSANRESDQKILSKLGIVAAPIIDPLTEQVLAVLVIQRIPMTSLTFYSVEMIRAVAGWVGVALGQSERYGKMAENSMIAGDGNALSGVFYKRQIEFLNSLAKRTGVKISVASLFLPPEVTRMGSNASQSAAHINSVISQSLRDTDLFFEGDSEGNSYHILLPTADAAAANMVVNKIKPKIAATLGLEGHQELIRCEIEVLGAA